MPLDLNDLPPIDCYPKSEQFTWMRLKQYFNEQYELLRKLTEDKSHMFEAHALQEQLKVDSDHIVFFERMFLEASLRHPENSGFVEEARTAYQRLLKAIPSHEETKLAFLRKTQDSLEGALEALRQGAQSDLPLDLKRVFRAVESHNRFAKKSEEASKIINEIINLIMQLTTLTRK